VKNSRPTDRLALVTLAAYIAADSLYIFLAAESKPKPSYLGIGLLLAAAVVMPWLLVTRGAWPQKEGFRILIRRCGRANCGRADRPRVRTFPAVLGCVFGVHLRIFPVHGHGRSLARSAPPHCGYLKRPPLAYVADSTCHAHPSRHSRYRSAFPNDRCAHNLGNLQEWNPPVRPEAPSEAFPLQLPVLSIRGTSGKPVERGRSDLSEDPSNGGIAAAMDAPSIVFIAYVIEMPRRWKP
jgi:hypothetical protein